MYGAEHIQAVLFDMDGTLLDSEHLTEEAVQIVLERYGVEVEVDCTRFHGVTWRGIAGTLRSLAPALTDLPLEVELQAYFHRGLEETAPPVIPGAPQAVAAAARRLSTALVSSSDRASVELVVGRLDLGEHFETLVCAEDCQRSKPDPQCYQIAAKRLGVDCAECLVFEDSVAGLQAARAAGMRTVAIGRDGGSDSPADLVIADFTELPQGFFDRLGAT